MLNYPITEVVRDAMQHFPIIARAVTILESDRSELEIVRLLGNTHYDHIQKLLKFMNTHLPSSGAIGKRIVQQTDPFQFKQNLAEFFLLVHLQGCPEVQAKVASTGSPSKKNYDINLISSTLNTRIEVYCPIDFYGFQLVESHIYLLFKYLDVDMGFCIDLRLETSVENGSYVYEIVNDEKTVRDWLTCLKSEAAQWLTNAQVGDRQQFKGVTDQMWLTATLREVNERTDMNCVTLSLPTQSTDTRLFFEVGQPEDTAASQWGRKLLHKLKDRQCGDPSSYFIRMLVIDFSHADTGFPDFICWPYIAERLSQTLKLLAAEAGAPLPYDAVLPARLSKECCFGKIVTLDDKRMKEVEQLVKAALLYRPCSRNHGN